MPDRTEPSHNCTGPGCPGCYAILNVPHLSDPSDSRNYPDPETEEYLQREQEKWERQFRGDDG